MGESVGERLRGLRGDRGMSLSELARRSGVGKGTISELENDHRSARLDTLFALTTALDAPLGTLIPDAGSPAAAPVSGASVTAVLIGRWDGENQLVEVYRAVLDPVPQHSSSHAAGVEETVTVVEGRVRVGVVGAERELATGESLRYPGDRPHLFEAVGAPARVILLMHYPHATLEKGTVSDDR